jgi:O-antigen/teichoic acid export membrane protein
MLKLMSKNVYIFKKAFRNPAILYIVSRYGTYIIKFVNSIFIAAYLGPYYLGIWGFLNLILGYIGQINFGIPNSVNVIISVNKKKEDYIRRIIGNGISMIFLLTGILLVLLLLIQSGSLNFGTKYNFTYYAPAIFVIGVLSHFNTLFTYVIRVYGKLFAIAVNQSLFPILTILLIPFYRAHDLLNALVLANFISTIVSLLLLIIQIPIKLKPLFNLDLIKLIQKKGIFLFLFNASFNLIMIATNSFISGNYSVEEFGYFTFSYTLANVILLLLNAISYIINPKMLNRFANYKVENIVPILNDIRISYISLSHFFIHLSIMIFPVFLIFFEKYNQSADAFKIVALTIALYSNSFGYQGLLIARNKEKLIGSISFLALLLNISISVVLVYLIKVPFSYVMLATTITYFLYSFLSCFFGRKELSLSYKIIATLNDVFPLPMIIPLITSFMLIFLSAPNIFFVIPFLLYISLNIKDLMGIKNMIVKVIKNPNFINI